MFIEWFEWMWRVTLSLANTESRPMGTALTYHFMYMTIMWRGVVGRKIGVKDCGVQGCCVDVRLGVGSCQIMVLVAANKDTTRVGAAARQF